MPNISQGVRAVIFDISGTVMDFGSRGPVAAFVELFARHGVRITEAEARRPMGLHKRDHVRELLENEAVAERWAAVHGERPGAKTLDMLYETFPPIQVETLKRHLDLLPGVAALTAGLRAAGIRFAATTGFESGMLEDIRTAAADQGYEPECWVTPDVAGGGRPAPWMIHYAARRMNVFPLRTFVKVGDTPADIAEALNAGTWAVAVVRTGNEIGLSREEWAALSDEERGRRYEAAANRLRAAGAHYVIDSVEALWPVLEVISERIQSGARP